MRAVAVLVVLVVAPFALAGCSAADDSVDLVKLPDGNYRVAIEATNTFAPMAGRVPVGATVEWLVSGGTHDVTEDSTPPAWSSDSEPANGTADTKLHFGDGYVHTFNEKGTFHYHCKIHGDMGMRGSITVV